MNPLQCALVEKMGNDNGFEHVLGSGAEVVTLASARHPARAEVTMSGAVFRLQFLSASPVLVPELLRSFPQAVVGQNQFSATGEAGLALLLRRAANLSRALPSQAATNYQQEVADELASLPAGMMGTEVERLVRQRVGQNRFREAMLDYWGGACAVIGVAIPEVLRASHAKPWAECSSDAERLDVFNGFLLSANLDALFDRFLISFDYQGRLIRAATIQDTDLLRLGIDPICCLRWVTEQHETYLGPHRARVLTDGGKTAAQCSN